MPVKTFKGTSGIVADLEQMLLSLQAAEVILIDRGQPEAYSSVKSLREKVQEALVQINKTVAPLYGNIVRTGNALMATLGTISELEDIFGSD
jgi:hypothetical protein